MIIVNSFQSVTIITKRSILDVATALDPPLVVDSNLVAVIQLNNRLSISRGGSRSAEKSKMERFVILVAGFQPLTIITKRSILDVAAALDPPLISIKNMNE